MHVESLAQGLACSKRSVIITGIAEFFLCLGYDQSIFNPLPESLGQ